MCARCQGMPYGEGMRGTLAGSALRLEAVQSMRIDRGDQLNDQDGEATFDLTGIKVMVIDDSVTIRRSAEVFLLQAGCQVILSEDGFDALAKVADHQPDIVFCDIVMPRLDGYQTCAILKRNQRFSTTPVVMLSSKDGLFDRARGKMAGSDEYLTKPFTRETLLQAVNTHVVLAGRAKGTQSLTRARLGAVGGMSS